MSDPLTISSGRVMISSPRYAWEEAGSSVNEGPEAMIRNGQVFVTYSASGCWTDAYGLGLLQASKDGDLLDPAAWTKHTDSVFRGDAKASVYGPGHNGFFQSPDGTQDWIIYHANESAGRGCGPARTPRIQVFTWNADGTPHFGTPVSAGQFVGKPLN